MAHVASLHVASPHIPSIHVPSISVRSIPVRPISIGSVLVASLPVGPVPIRSAPVFIAVLSLEMPFHMKSARAAAMKARTSSRHGFRPRQKDTSEANSGDGDQCSRRHQLHNSKHDGLQASRMVWRSIISPPVRKFDSFADQTGAMVKKRVSTLPVPSMQDFSVSPLALSFHSSHSPAIASPGARSARRPDGPWP
jgi:hypothetical protein